MRESRLPDGSLHIHFPSVGSTNEELTARFDALQSGEKLWITADEQTEGRGRSGRTWVSRPGNLYASCGFEPEVPMALFAQVTFVAATAMAITIETVCGLEGRVKVKWPNDILLDGRKICGILLETANAAGRTFIIAGFGLNCRHAPETGLYPTAFLAAEGVESDPSVLFAGLSRNFTKQLEKWDCGRGFDRIRADWLKRVYGLGEPVSVRFSHGTRDGIFEGLEPDGRLRLRGADGKVEFISAGDIFF